MELCCIDNGGSSGGGVGARVSKDPINAIAYMTKYRYLFVKTSNYRCGTVEVVDLVHTGARFRAKDYQFFACNTVTVS